MTVPVSSTITPPPPRPARWQESLANRLFLAFSPRLSRSGAASPPASLSPFEDVAIHRDGQPGALAATWYPAPGAARGAVLLLHPWTARGRAYFHRHGRIEALRSAGFHALTFDFPGFGGSAPSNTFFDRDVDHALAFLERRAPGVPHLVWGVSAGGFWAHPAIARSSKIVGAVFEDVSPHLFEWSWRRVPHWRPNYLLFRTLFPACYRYLDIRRHAFSMASLDLVYVSGKLDRGVTPEDTESLARAASAPFHVIPAAGHLASIKMAHEDVLGWGLETLEAAITRESRAAGG